ncbi:MAG: hypothetical protein IH984_05875 [Planctomycetes bacterium]|nr:hypothetical protein [Planctomycetota bacterium]
MPNLRSIVCRSRNLLLIAIVLTLNACGSSEPEETAVQAPTVDPRYATAQSLIDYYNTIERTSREYLPRSLELYYVETPLQEKIYRLNQTIVAHAALRNELKDYFGEALELYTWEDVLANQCLQNSKR